MHNVVKCDYMDVYIRSVVECNLNTFVLFLVCACEIKVTLFVISLFMFNILDSNDISYKCFNIILTRGVYIVVSLELGGGN